MVCRHYRSLNGLKQSPKPHAFPSLSVTTLEMLELHIPVTRSCNQLKRQCYAIFHCLRLDQLMSQNLLISAIKYNHQTVMI